VDAAAGALCDVDDYLPLGSGFGEGINEPFFLWGITCSVCAEYYSFKFFCAQQFLDNFLLYAWEEREDNYVAVVFVVCFQFQSGDVFLYVAVVELYIGSGHG
jgi:hypothetical protein